MKKRKNFGTGILAAFGMLLLILDTKTALSGAVKGITLCLQTVIPSLFPFIILSFLINKSFVGIPITILTPLGKLCGIPKGAESLFLLGLVGGYPVGAQSIENAYRNGCLSRWDARRMLGFCSNAGPAFIFGMAGGLFHSQIAAWALWAVHITSAIIAGYILPGKTQNTCKLNQSQPVNITLAVEKGLKTMGLICAWVVIFRVIITFFSRWFLWLLPKELEVAIIGLIELSNGCCELYALQNEGLRFILCATFLSLGGVCVGMQTCSVTQKLGTGMYFPGKVLQGCISFLVAYMLQNALFDGNEIFKIPMFLLFVAFLLCFVAFLYIKQKNSSNFVANTV